MILTLGTLLFMASSVPFGFARAAQINVSMVGMTFSPSTITIAAGDTVLWMNNSSLQHTVTADDGSFDSGTINMGGMYSHTFMTPGTYHYYCRFHGGPGGVGMSGTIVVTGSSPQPSSAPNPTTNPTNPNPQSYPPQTYPQSNYQQLYWCGSYYSYAPCPSMNYGNYNSNYNNNTNYNGGSLHNPYSYYSFRPCHFYYSPYQYQTSYYPRSYDSYGYNTYPMQYGTQSNGSYSHW